MLKRIPLELITRNPDQPRQTFRQDRLIDLANSIAENGLQQPITVRPIPEAGDGVKYMIVMGERRFRAHLILAEQGKAKDVLAHVRRMDDGEMAINAIIENLQRDDVSPIEEGRAFQNVMDSLKIDKDELAKRLGITRSCYIRYRVSLLNLTGDNQALLDKGVINFTQAVAMSGLSPNGQTSFLDLCKRGLVTTMKAANDAAAAIAARENQNEMFSAADTPKRNRAEIKGLEKKVDDIGLAVSALFKDGSFEVTTAISAQEADRCSDKIKLLLGHLRQIDNEIKRAALVSEVA